MSDSTLSPEHLTPSNAEKPSPIDTTVRDVVALLRMYKSNPSEKLLDQAADLVRQYKESEKLEAEFNGAWTAMREKAPDGEYLNTIMNELYGVTDEDFDELGDDSEDDGYDSPQLSEGRL